MSVSTNADLYTADRVNIFFTANNETPADGNLTGQCVTLVKWFMQDMTAVPAPFSARGDARNTGKTLVAQGHAIEVPYAQRKRGDIICYEYGVYGHTAVQLSGGRVFESNVNWSGVASKIVDGDRVFASRIGNENEPWRHDQHVYRLKSYNDIGGTITMDEAAVDLAFKVGLNRPATPNEIAQWKDKSPNLVLQTIFNNNVDFRSKSAQYDALLEKYNDCSSGDGTVLSSGKYIVK